MKLRCYLLLTLKSDVVATTFTQTQNSIKVEFANNSAVKISANYINKIFNRLALLTLSDDQHIAAESLVLIALIPCFPKIRQRTIKIWNACKQILPQEITEDDFDHSIKGLFVESEGVRSAKVVSELFNQLLSFSREPRPATEANDRAIWVIFLNNAYHVGKAILFRLAFYYG